MKTKITIIVIGLFISFTTANAQTNFGPQQIISTAADGAWSVYASDLDGDGDIDVLSASIYDDKIAWYENDGTGNFEPQQIITTLADVAKSVYASDLDGDGDIDVLSASVDDDKIAWYENDGAGNFGPQQIITTAAYGAKSVYASDLDGDNDMDVLSASQDDNKIAWYENDGNGNFGSQQIISTLASAAQSVYASDLDGDGDMDVLSASLLDGKIAWYENDGNGNFGAQQIITLLVNSAYSVYTSDLDGDSDIDVLSASIGDDKIAWYENDGTGNFGSQQIITTLADGAASVYACDLDGDGDIDVLSASKYDEKIAWYENDGTGNFGNQQVITTAADFTYSVYASDLDGDNDIDVLSASMFDDKTAWYENFAIQIVTQPVEQNICPNSNANFTLTANGADTYQWQVDEGSGFNDLANNSVYSGVNTNSLQIINATLYMSGYLYRCVVSNPGGSLYSDAATLTVGDDIDPTITCVNNQTINLSQGQTTYTVTGIEFDPTAIDDNCEVVSVINDFNSLSTLDEANFPLGTTTVVWTVTDIVENQSYCSFDVTVNAYTGVETLEQKGITIYPNPTKGIIYFEFADNNIQEIKISDITGKTISTSASLNANNEQLEIDLSSFYRGIYIIRIQTDKEIFTTKIVIE